MHEGQSTSIPFRAPKDTQDSEIYFSLKHALKVNIYILSWENSDFIVAVQTPKLSC